MFHLPRAARLRLRLRVQLRSCRELFNHSSRGGSRTAPKSSHKTIVSQYSISTCFDDRPIRCFSVSPRARVADEKDFTRPFPPITPSTSTSPPQPSNSEFNSSLSLNPSNSTPTSPVPIPTGPLKPFDDKPKRDRSLPPEKPKPDECCGEYCVNCVWLQYIDELFDFLGPRIETTDIEDLVGTFDADEGVKAYVLLEAKLRKKKYATEE